MSLGQKALGGFFWTFTSSVGNKIITLVISTILARLLMPKDFGLVAMIYIFFQVSKSLMESGFAQALIREKDITERDKSTVFYINIIISTLLLIILWFSAPFIAKFFEAEILIDLVRFMSLSLIFQALSIVQGANLNHGLAFKNLTKITLTSDVFTGVVAVILAFYGFGVWALAIKYVSHSFFKTMMFYIINPWYPKKFISKESAQRLFGFGSKLLISGIINKVYENIYKIIIGKYFDVATLGFFTQAQLYLDHITQGVTTTIQNVTYPILSKTNNDDTRLKIAYRKIIIATSYFLFPLVVGIGVLAEPLILTLIGEKWTKSIPFLQILCLSGILFHLHNINLNILKVKGRSDLFLKLEIIKRFLLTIAIIIGLQYGIWGLLIGRVINSYISLLINMYYTNKFIGYSYKDQFKDLLPIIIYTIPMFILIFLFLHTTSFSAIINLLVGIIIGIFSYLLLTYFLKSRALFIIFELFGEKYSFIKKYQFKKQ